MAALVDALRSDGWHHQPQFLDAALTTALRTDLEQQRGQFAAAAVGRAQQRQQHTAIRSDRTLWLSGASAAQQLFAATLEELRRVLNRDLYLNLVDCEAHYALYAPGAFYRRHLDAFSNDDSRAPRRAVSMVCYLNDAWPSKHGGELVLWDRNERELMRITPTGGSAIFFLSDEFPHEVLPACAERYSIAAWFRTRGAAQ